MIFQIKSIEELAHWIRQRAIEIEAGEGRVTEPPLPGIYRLKDPAEFGGHWILSDYQNMRGLGAIKIAAAEASVIFDLPPE